jgi:malonate transporter
MIESVLGALAPVFFVLALGYLAGKFRRVDNQHVDSLNALVMDVALPAALFVAMAQAPRAEMLRQAGLFATFVVAMLAVFGLGLLISVKLLRRDKRAAALQALTYAVPNVGAAGLPVVAALFDRSAATAAATNIVAAALVAIPLSMLIIEALAPPPRPPLPRLLLGLYAKPVVLAPLLGILLSLAGLSPPGVLDRSVMLIGQATAGVALFLTGLVVSAQPFRFSGDVALGVVLKNLLQPALTAGLALLLLPPELARVAVVLCAIPASFFGVLLAIRYRLPTEAIGTMLIVSTVASAATLAAAIALTAGW